MRSLLNEDLFAGGLTLLVLLAFGGWVGCDVYQKRQPETAEIWMIPATSESPLQYALKICDPSDYFVGCSHKGNFLTLGAAKAELNKILEERWRRKNVVKMYDVELPND